MSGAPQQKFGKAERTDAFKKITSLSMQPIMMMPYFSEAPRVRKPHPKSKFSEEEDERLRSLVAEFGDTDWHLIARKMENRNARQCRERWRNYLCPDVDNGPWSEEEDQRLDEMYAIHGPKWKYIANFFPGRTDINIKSRWQVHLRRASKQLIQGRKLPRIPKSIPCSFASQKPAVLSQPPQPADPAPAAEDPADQLWDDTEFQDYVDAAYLCPDIAPFGSEAAEWYY